MVELANKKADTSWCIKKEDMVLKIQNKIREDVNNPELWAQLGDAYMQMMNLIMHLLPMAMQKKFQAQHRLF